METSWWGWSLITKDTLVSTLLLTTLDQVQTLRPILLIWTTIWCWMSNNKKLRLTLIWVLQVVALSNGISKVIETWGRWLFWWRSFFLFTTLIVLIMVSKFNLSNINRRFELLQHSHSDNSLHELSWSERWFKRSLLQQTRERILHLRWYDPSTTSNVFLGFLQLLIQPELAWHLSNGKWVRD